MMQEDIINCVKILKQGGVILYPTDTIWGLGCDASNEAAVAKIFEIKKRVLSKSMIVIVNDEEMLKLYSDANIQLALQHISNAKKPVTMIYPMAKNLAKNVIAENGSVAIRIVQDQFCKELIAAFGKPIVSTSANISNEDFPSFYKEIDNEIKLAVDYIVKYRQEDSTATTPSQLAMIQEDAVVKILRE